MTRKCFSILEGVYTSSESATLATHKSSHRQRSEVYLKVTRKKIRYSMPKKNDSAMIVFWGGHGRMKKV